MHQRCPGSSVPIDLDARCRELVSTSFGAAFEYALLCGSTAHGTAGPVSDLDIFVALRDDVPIGLARELRARFEEKYLALHEALGRIPDRLFPGEIMYARDADHAVRDSALFFDGESLAIAAESLPFRYWLGMQATGRRLFPMLPKRSRLTAACAELIRWRVWNLTMSEAWRWSTERIFDSPDWQFEWHLPIEVTAVRRALSRGIAVVRSELAVSPGEFVCQGDLRRWASGHRRDAKPPSLESDRPRPQPDSSSI